MTGIEELFTDFYRVRWRRKKNYPSILIGDFKAADGSPVEIAVSEGDAKDGWYELSFSRDQEIEPTGTGDQYKVLGTVFKAAGDFVRDHDEIEGIYWQAMADKSEPIYHRLMQRFLPEFKRIDTPEEYEYGWSGVRFYKRRNGEVEESFTIERHPEPLRGNAYYFWLMLDGKRVGHVGGIENKHPLHYFDVMNVHLDEDQRGKGWFQSALQQIADEFPDGIKSLKVQTSRSFEKAMRKMPDYRDQGYNHAVLNSKQSVGRIADRVLSGCDLSLIFEARVPDLEDKVVSGFLKTVKPGENNRLLWDYEHLPHEEAMTELEKNLRGRYKEAASFFSHLPEPIPLWRAVTVTVSQGASLEDVTAGLDLKKVGLYWSHEKEAAVPWHGGHGEPAVLHAGSLSSSVDWETTLRLAANPWVDQTEKEVRLLRGKPITIIGVSVGGKDYDVKLKGKT